jgi:hypothetical protein
VSDTNAWPIAIFAHNEGEHILRCLESLTAGASGHPIVCYVLANGCGDDTERLVAGYAARHTPVHLVSIARGDKANAWNEYVHRIAPTARVHFFLDGDCRAAAGALRELAGTLAATPQANAAAAVPFSGRSREASRRAMIAGAELAGNLYALSGDFVERLKSRHIRLPIGLIGEDSLVGALAKWNLDAASPWQGTRVAVAPRAGFHFDSLSIIRPEHWKLYLDRRIRYRIRAHQLYLLRPIIKQRGFEGLPNDICELYPAELPNSGSKVYSLEQWFDRQALKRMQEQAAAQGSSITEV